MSNWDSAKREVVEQFAPNVQKQIDSIEKLFIDDYNCERVMKIIFKFGDAKEKYVTCGGGSQVSYRPFVENYMSKDELRTLNPVIVLNQPYSKNQTFWWQIILESWQKFTYDPEYWCCI